MIKYLLKSFLLSTSSGKNLYHKFISNKNTLFRSVELETTSICNRKCSYCPNYSQKRTQGYMKEELFYKIIDELVVLNFSGRFSPHFYGEPLLDKRIVRFITYTRKKLPKTFIKLFTNGDFLTYKCFVELMEAGVDVFRIALHDNGLSDTLKLTLSKVNDKDKKRRIELVKYFDNDDLLMNRGGLISVKHDLKMKYCGYVSGITIDYEGNMLLCCQDYFSKYKFGNLKSENIIDIWNKPGYKRTRDKISSGLWALKICKTCNGLK